MGRLLIPRSFRCSSPRLEVEDSVRRTIQHCNSCRIVSIKAASVTMIWPPKEDARLRVLEGHHVDALPELRWEFEERKDSCILLRAHIAEQSLCIGIGDPISRVVSLAFNSQWHLNALEHLLTRRRKSIMPRSLSVCALETFKPQ